MEQWLQYALAGIRVGSIYGIVAIGFNIVYNTTGIINFAQGEFLVVGAMLAITLAQWMPLALAVPAAVVLTALLGALIGVGLSRGVPRPTVLRLIIVTIGLSILLREGVSEIWGKGVRTLPFFTGTEVSSIPFFGARITAQDLWVLAVCGLIVAGLGVFFKFTLTGRAMRACAANPTAARLCGISVGRMVALSFMLSAGIGALAGCVISPVTQTQYDMGAPLAIKGFTVAVLGGLGSSMAAVAAGLLLGLLESFSICIFPEAYKDAVCIALLLGVLIVRPTGLFGSRASSALKEF